MTSGGHDLKDFATMGTLSVLYNLYNWNQLLEVTKAPFYNINSNI